MTNVPYPILKWRDAREKEWTFRQMLALGYWRDYPPSSASGPTDREWTELMHDPDRCYMYAYVSPTGYRIWFARERDGRPSDAACQVVLVNSGPHFISYLKRHGLVPPKPHA